MEASANLARKGGDKVKGMLEGGRAGAIVNKKLEGRRAAALVKEKRAEIAKHIQRPNIQGENFVTIASLREVWRWGGLQEFIEGVGLGFEANKKQLDYIDKHLLRTISILVFSRWEKWQKFPIIFMENGDFRKDRL